MKSAKFKIFSLVSLLIVIGIFAWYVAKNWPKFQEIHFGEPALLPLALVFILANVYSLGALLEVAVEPHGVKLSKSEIFGLSTLTRFGNHVSPGYLGTAIRATYIKKNYGVSYAKFSSSFVLSNLIQLIISGVIAILVYSYLAGAAGINRPIIYIAAAVMLFAFMLYAPLSKILPTISRLRQRYNNKITKGIYVSIKQFVIIKKHPNLLAIIIFWMVMGVLSSTLVVILLSYSIDAPIDFLPALFISALSGWSIVFSITPASIGIREGLMVLGAQLVNIEIPIILSVALIIRVLTLSSVSILATYYAPALLHTTLLSINKIQKEN